LLAGCGNTVIIAILNIASTAVRVGVTVGVLVKQEAAMSDHSFWGHDYVFVCSDLVEIQSWDFSSCLIGNDKTSGADARDSVHSNSARDPRVALDVIDSIASFAIGVHEMCQDVL